MFKFYTLLPTIVIYFKLSNGGLSLAQLAVEGKPGGAEHPFSVIRNSLDKILAEVSVAKILNGDERTNRERVEVEVRVQKPPLTEIIYFLHYSLAALCESSLERWDCHHCKLIGSHIQLIRVIYNEEHHTKSFIALDLKKRQIVLVFRAVINLGGTFTPLMLLPKTFGPESLGIKIHSGFLKSVQSDFDTIVSSLNDLISLHPDCKVVVAGYSLGGQQASVMLFLLKYHNPFPQTQFELYTYGQGRTGNKGYADFMNNLTIPMVRVVSGDDLFVRFIPAVLGYYHHQNEFFMEDDGNGSWTGGYCSNEFYEDPTCGQSRGASLVIFQSLLLGIEHLVYFGMDTTKCLTENPFEYLLQIVWPLQKWIPKEVLKNVPSFEINTTAVVNFIYLTGMGGRKIFNLANGRARD